MWLFFAAKTDNELWALGPAPTEVTKIYLKWSKHVKKLSWGNNDLSRFLLIASRSSCVSVYSNNRSSEHPHPPSTDSRASSVSADRGRTETVQIVELFPLEDLIYYGRGKSERMMDINIKNSVVLKTASAWQRQKSRLLITRGARIASRLFERATATPLLIWLYALFTLWNIGNVHAGHIDASQIVL